MSRRRIIINGIKTNYKISSKGKVYSMNYNHTKKVKELKQYPNKMGYLLVGLYVNGINMRISVHRLVATAFISNPNNYEQINHIDGNHTNNNVNNLEWCTAKYNIHHALDNGLIKVGEKSVHSTLSNKIVKSICEDLSTGDYSLYELSIKYNTTYHIINDIYRKKSWKSISANFNFPKKIKYSKGARGEKNVFAKITNDTAKSICKDISLNNLSLKEIAKNTTLHTKPFSIFIIELHGKKYLKIMIFQNIKRRNKKGKNII